MLKLTLYAEDNDEIDEALISQDRMEFASAKNDSLPTSLSAIAVHHGWAKEPSDNTGENMYRILYRI
jgi:predicted hydrocarbon binding protein